VSIAVIRFSIIIFFYVLIGAISIILSGNNFLPVITIKYLSGKLFLILVFGFWSANFTATRFIGRTLIKNGVLFGRYEDTDSRHMISYSQLLLLLNDSLKYVIIRISLWFLFWFCQSWFIFEFLKYNVLTLEWGTTILICLVTYPFGYAIWVIMSLIIGIINAPFSVGKRRQTSAKRH